MPYVTTPDGCKLYYTTDNFEADRPPVVFLNGTSQTTIYWEPHIAAFAKHFRVLRYDARAQGKSDIGPRCLSAEIHISDLQHLLAHLGVQKTHLIGISHGAYVALRLAATEPEKVDRLVLASIGRDSQSYVKQVVSAWQKILQGADLKTMAWATLPLVFGKRFLNQNRQIHDKIIAAIAARNSKEALVAHFQAIADYASPQKFLKTMQCPTLVICGADDPIVSSEDARLLAKDCRGRHEIFPQIGHSIPAEAPVAFQQVVLEFLNQR